MAISSGTVSNSYSSSLVTGEIVPGSTSSGNPGPLGGLIGEVDAGTVINSHASGNVTAVDGNYMGGLIGQTNNVGVTVSNTYATGNVSATSIVNGGASIGGLIGDSFDAVTNSYASGNVTGEQFVGGLIGSAENSSVVTNAYATGNVTGNVNSTVLGGLIGSNNGNVTNAYATGAVTGGDHLGGLVGLNVGQLTSVYATGFVGPAPGASPTVIGGLVGENDGSIATSYWDTYSTGQASGVGLDGGFGTDLLPVTSDPTQSGAANYAFTQTAYGNLNFATDWFMIDGQTRPFGQWEHTSTIVNSHQLQLMSMDLNASYVLGSNIDASETGGADPFLNVIPNPSGMWTAAGFVPVAPAVRSTAAWTARGSRSRLSRSTVR